MTYTEITQAQFEELLNRQGYKWEVSEEKFAKETVYLLKFKNVMVKVFSSLVGGVGRDVGADAIRVVGWDPVSNLPVMSNEHRVYRTEGWRQNLISRIQSAEEKMKNIEKCDKCGGMMVERINTKTKESFMGCLNWKNHGKCNLRPGDFRLTENKNNQDVITDNKRVMENKRVIEEVSPSAETILDNKLPIVLNMAKKETKVQDYSGIKYYEVIGDEPLMVTSDFEWGKFSFERFNPIQTRLAEFVPQDNNIVIEAKTSTGKTQMGEMFMWYVLGIGKKIIYTSPLKALTREKWDSWTTKFAGFKIAIVTGDYRLTDKRIKELNEANIILCTSEMLDHRTRNMASEKSEWLKNAGLLILDEMQMIGIKDRGDKLEAGLVRFTKINAGCRIVVLSGTMPNSSEMASWINVLNGKETVLIRSGWRPVKLNMIYDRYDDTQGYYAAKDNLFTKVMLEIKKHEKEKILVFVHSKTDGRRILAMLDETGYRAEFHNADLEIDDRVNIEESFKRRSDESVRIIIATSTLAYGLNLPARIVIVTGMHRGIEEVSELDIIQMCGRSGRMGIDTEGDAIILLPDTHFDELKKKIENPGDIVSQINNPLIAAFHVIGEIVGKTIKTREDVYKWYGRTLAARQNIAINKEYVDKLINYLLENNSIRDVNGQLVETELGKAAVYFYLRPDMLKDLMDSWNKIFEIGVENNDFMMSRALSKLRMYDETIVSKADRPYIESYHKAAKAIENTFGSGSEGQSKIGMAYLNMIRGVKGFEVKDGKKIMNPLASVQRTLQQDIERVAQAMMYIDAKYSRWGKGNYWSVIGLRLRYGIGQELVGLCSLEGIGGTYAKRLYDAGIKNPVELLTKKKEAIMALGAKYDGIIEKNKDIFTIMGYNIGEIKKDIPKKETVKKERIDDNDVLKFPS